MAEEVKNVQGENVGANPAQPKSGTGMEPNVIGLLSYLFAPLSSLIFYLTEKDSPRWGDVKMYVMQSLYLGLVSLGAAILTSWWTCGIVNLVIFVYQIYLAIKAFQNEKVEVPVIKNWVK